MTPKPVLNNKITYPNVYGRIVKHDTYLNQDVRKDSSPTFGNLLLTGDLSVLGRTFILNTNLTQYENNIILVNKTDTGPGVTLNLSGFEINRGTLENYRAVYDEFSKTFRIGLVSDTRAVVTRDNTPLIDGIMLWNTSGNIISSNTIPNGTTFNNSLFAKGGVAFLNSDIKYNNTRGNLEISSLGGIGLNPTTEIAIPQNKLLKFGENISIKNSDGNLCITANSTGSLKGIDLDTVYLKIVQSSGNTSFTIVSNGSLEISNSNKTIEFENETNLVFKNSTNSNNTTNNTSSNVISSKNGSLTFSAQSDITLKSSSTSSTSSNVNLIFGTSGNEFIKCESGSGELLLSAQNGVRIKQDIPLTFGENETLSESIKGTTDKKLVFDSGAGVVFNNTLGSNSVDSGSAVFNGGVGVGKNIIAGGDVHVAGDLFVNGTTSYVNTETIIAENNLVITNNAGATGVDGGLLIRRDISAVTATPNLAYAGLFYKESTGRLTFGYTGTTTSNLTITQATPIEANGLMLTSTDNVSGNLNNPLGSFVINGGGVIKRDLWVGGLLTTSSLVAGAITSANTVFTNTTVNNLTITTNLNVKSQDDVQNLTTASITLSGGMGIVKGLQVGGAVRILEQAQATSLTTGGAFVVDGGVRIAKDAYLGGDTYINGTTYIADTHTASGTSGSLIVQGGVNIKSNLLVKGETTLLDTLNLTGGDLNLGFSNFQTITNTSGALAWYYVGLLNTSGTFNTQFSAMCQKTQLDMTISKSGSGQPLIVDHCVKGELQSASVSQSQSAVIYNDINSNPHLFIRVTQNEFINLHVLLHKGTSLTNGKFEGTGTSPDGSLSGYSGAWVKSYSTETVKPDLQYNIGNILSTGDTVQITDNLPIIGKDKTSSKEWSGYLLQRYQTENDTSTGDVICDTTYESGTIPAQLVLDPELPNPIAETQIILGNWANATNDYYNGCWIRVMTGVGAGQVRKISTYSGGLRVANLVTKWTPGKIPQLGDTIRIFNRSFIAHYFSESEGSIKSEWGTFDETTHQLTTWGDIPQIFGKVTFSDTTVSVNSSTGALVISGGIGIRCSDNSTSATSGGGLTVAGGVAIEKGLYISDQITISRTSFTHGNSMYIKSSVGSLVFDNDTGNYSHIQFKATSDSNFVNYNIVADSGDNLFKIKCGQNVLTGTTGFVMTSSGNIGIKTTNNTSIGSALTLGVNNIISADSQNGYIGMGQSGSAGAPEAGAGVLLWGNDSGNGTAGNLKLSSGANGELQFETANTQRISVTSSGSTLFKYSLESTNSSTGAVVVNGGVSIKNSTNATSITCGGGLTVAGGASITKDLYIGGDIYIGDELFYSGQNSVQRPVLTFSNGLNCNVVNYNDSSLLYIYTEGIFSVCVQVLPTSEGIPCQFEFEIPGRTSNFVNRNDIKGFVSGYTDDTNIIPVFNTLCVAQPSSKKALVKFHSASSSLHYITLLCRYTIV